MKITIRKSPHPDKKLWNDLWGVRFCGRLFGYYIISYHKPNKEEIKK